MNTLQIDTKKKQGEVEQRGLSVASCSGTRSGYRV